MRISFFVKAGHGPDWHRMVVPMESLVIKEGDSIKMGIYGMDEVPDLFDCDILIFNRSIKTPVDQLERLRKRYGFKIVLDLDDYWELGSTHPLYQHWQSEQIAEMTLGYIKMADLVTVTNERLATKVSLYNQNVAIIPNALPFDPLVPKSSDKTRFIYAGSITHIPDIEILKNRFGRIDPYIRDRASFLLAGVGDHAGWDGPKKIFKATGSYEFLPVLPLDQYMRHYDNADVALVPLIDNEFNGHKSILKVMEAASRGLPCLVSKVLPYYPELQNAPGISWVEDGSDWLRLIRFHIKNRNWSKDQGVQLYNYIKDRYSLDEINKIRYEVLRLCVHPRD